MLTNVAGYKQYTNWIISGNILLRTGRIISGDFPVTG